MRGDIHLYESIYKATKRLRRNVSNRLLSTFYHVLSTFRGLSSKFRCYVAASAQDTFDVAAFSIVTDEAANTPP
jgi:hypothetical protein